MFLRNQNNFITGSFDGLIKAWHFESTYLAEGNNLSTNTSLLSITFSKDKQIATGHRNGLIKLWNPSTKSLLHTLSNTDKSDINCLKVLHNNYLISGSSAGNLAIWDIEKAKQKHFIQTNENIASIIIISKDLFASGSLTGLISIWSAKNYSLLMQLKEKPNRSYETYTEMVLLNNKSLAFGFKAVKDGGIIIWNIKEQSTRKIIYTDGYVKSLAVLTNGLLAAGDSNGEIRIWDTESTLNQAIHILKNDHTSKIMCLLELSSGKMASGSFDGSVFVWEIDFCKYYL